MFLVHVFQDGGFHWHCVDFVVMREVEFKDLRFSHPDVVPAWMWSELEEDSFDLYLVAILTHFFGLV